MVSMSESLHAPARVAPHRSEHLFALWRGRPSSSSDPVLYFNDDGSLYSPQTPAPTANHARRRRVLARARAEAVVGARD